MVRRGWSSTLYGKDGECVGGERVGEASFMGERIPDGDWQSGEPPKVKWSYDAQEPHII